jgi:hypothetical protein
MNINSVQFKYELELTKKSIMHNTTGLQVDYGIYKNYLSSKPAKCQVRDEAPNLGPRV